MSDHRPPTLGYAVPSRRPPSGGAFVFGAVVLAIVFFVAANVIEGWTLRTLADYGDRLGRFSLPEAEQRHLVMHGDADMMVETVWSFPAASVFFAAVVTVPPHRGWKLRWPVFVVTLLGAVAYSWVRWGLDVLRLKLGDGAELLIATSLAATAGLATGLERRWSKGRGPPTVA